MAAGVLTTACLAVAALVSLAALVGRPRDPVPGIALGLEFLLAGGLVHLGASRTWTALAIAAAIVVVRKVAVRGLQLGAASLARRPTA